MFTCAKIRNGRTYLAKHLTANDYYNEHEQVLGKWIGRGSLELGLSEKPIGAKDKAFEALRNNQYPDGSGRALTPNLNKEKAIRFFDFQCSAQKSVSIMAVLANDRRLYEAHDRASEKAFNELERFAAFQTGSAKNRTRETSGNLCGAAFRHDASRALDPQIHTHFVIANATWDDRKKSWKALDPHDMFKAIRYAGKVYQNELALQCRRLGYEIEPSRNEKSQIEGFEITGVSEEIRKTFSKRRAEVEAGIERFLLDKGRPPTTKEINVITRETRGQKMTEIATAAVRKNQLDQLPKTEIAALTNKKLHAIKAELERSRSNTPLVMEPVSESLQRASEHVFERESAISGHKLMSETLNQALGYTDLDSLQRHMTAENSGIIQLTPNKDIHSSFWASVRGLRLEQDSIAFINQTRGVCPPLGKIFNINFDFKSDEQRRVVLETLKSRDKVYAIQGRAGTGKTTALKEIRKGLEAANRNGIYLAPTAAAVKVLINDGFENATTVDSFICSKRSRQLGSDDVIVIDEAGLLSTEKGAAVLKAAVNARVLLVGDTHQHVSVEAGDFLRVLLQHSKLRSSELKEIIRQQVADYNHAVRELAENRTVEGLSQIDSLGWICETKKEYIERAADAYIADTANGTKLDQCIAISPTWAENYRFTDSIRQKLKNRKLLSKNGARFTVCNQLDWTKQQMRSADNYLSGMMVTFNAHKTHATGGKTLTVDRIENGLLHLTGYGKPIDPQKHAKNIYSVSLPRSIELTSGDKILLRKNEKKAGLTNGDIFTVDRINADGSIKTRIDRVNTDGSISREAGPDIPPEYRHFTHGYVVTSHKSQGATKTNTVIAAESLDTKSAYVSFSRSRQKATLFTPDKNSLFYRLGTPTDRLSAVEALTSARSGFAEKEKVSMAALTRLKEFYLRIKHIASAVHHQNKTPDIERRQDHGQDYGMV